MLNKLSFDATNMCEINTWLASGGNYILNATAYIFIYWWDLDFFYQGLHGREEPRRVPTPYILVRYVNGCCQLQPLGSDCSGLKLCNMHRYSVGKTARTFQCLRWQCWATSAKSLINSLSKNQVLLVKTWLLRWTYLLSQRRLGRQEITCWQKIYVRMSVDPSLDCITWDKVSMFKVGRSFAGGKRIL